MALVAVALVLTAAAGAIGRARAVRAQAQAGADLAALAAADAVALPPGVTATPEALARVDPCARAQEVARRNGCRLVTCTPHRGGVIDVRVTAGPHVGPAVGPFSGVLSARADARAGPAWTRG